MSNYLQALQKMFPVLFWRILSIASFVTLLILTLSPNQKALIQVENIDKLYHFIAFAGVTTLLTLAFRKIHFYTAILGLIALGLVIEVAQIWIPGRGFSWLDWLADSLGVLAFGYLFKPLLISTTEKKTHYSKI